MTDELMRIAADNAKLRKAYEPLYPPGVVGRAADDIDALIALVEQQRGLIADLSQDGRNAAAYERGVEEGKRAMKEAVLEAVLRDRDTWLGLVRLKMEEVAQKIEGIE